MIRITHDISIPDEAVTLEYARASGPGGQHVNKTASAVRLRFAAADCGVLPLRMRARLRVLAGNRLTADGVLLLESDRFRSQSRNREDVLERFAELLREAAAKPKPRIATRATRGSHARRLESKQRHGEIKRLRQSSAHD